MKRLRTYLIIILLMGMMTLMCGCDSTLASFALNEFHGLISDKADANKEMALSLYQGKFIDESLYNSIVEQIDSVTNPLLTQIAEAQGDIEKFTLKKSSAFLNAASYVKVYKPLCVQIVKDDGTIKVDTFDGDVLSGEPGDSDSATSFLLGNCIANQRNITSTSGLVGIDGVSRSGSAVQGTIFNDYAWTTEDIYGWANVGRNDDKKGGHVYSERPSYKIAWAKTDSAGMSTSPLNYFGGCTDELEKQLNEKFNLPVYVLDTDNIKNNDKSIDEVLAAVQAAVEKGDMSGVSNYFKQVPDFHLMPDDFKLVMDSEFPYLGDKNGTYSATQYDATKVGPGYDVIIKQDILELEEHKGDTWYYHTTNEPVAAIRFFEFNQQQFDLLNQVYNINNTEGNRFYFDLAGNTKGAFLVEYPVSTIDGFKASDDGEYAVASFDNNSGIGINLRNSSDDGNIVVYDVEGTTYTDTGHSVNDSYLTAVFGSQDSNTGKSSFIVNGYNDISLKYKTLNSDNEIVDAYKTITVPRIILRDYLEATWAPGMVSDENLVVFGRKIRFDMSTNMWKDINGTQSLCYNLNDNNQKIAYFIDKDGNEVGSQRRLTLFDFCKPATLNSSTSGKVSDCYVLRFPKPEEASISKEYSGDEGDTQPRIENLALVTTDTLTVNQITDFSIVFPGSKIGIIDKDNSANEITRFYVVATTKGMFDSALYSDWINSTSTTASMTWWNQWLEEHNYKYRVNAEDVVDYVGTNYKYEMSQEGAVVLDLTTVSKIQESFDKEENRQHARLIRSLFIIIGFILIAYSMILMLCWIIDTHTDLGLSTVNKLTFGHWTAVAYDSDIPNRKQNDKSYVDGKRIFIRCLILVLIAIVLLIVDINHIIYLLIDGFGDLAKKLNHIIQG